MVTVFKELKAQRTQISKTQRAKLIAIFDILQ